jgi:hypothetical protein
MVTSLETDRGLSVTYITVLMGRWFGDKTSLRLLNVTWAATATTMIAAMAPRGIPMAKDKLLLLSDATVEDEGTAPKLCIVVVIKGELLSRVTRSVILSDALGFRIK